jgi:hypothetical protein
MATSCLVAGVHAQAGANPLVTWQPMMTMSVPVALPMIDKVPLPELAASSVRRPTALASRISRLVGHLIKLPVADPQCGSDVLGLGAVQDQALHSTVERRPGNVGFVLGMNQPLLGLPGLGQPLLIHMAHIDVLPA